MAINANALRRPSDRPLFLTAAILFPLVVLAGYFKSYYFSAFFDVPSVANMLVHAHAAVMTLWVVYFSAQIALIRTKNVRLHMTMGLVGVGLAALVVAVGTATAYDAQLVRGSAPPGVNPHSFFVLPMLDMALFVVFFSGAIYYRKRPTEHKTLMLMTAIAFMLAALACLGWHTAKHRKLNKVFAASVLLVIAAHPLRIALLNSEAWLRFTAWLAP